ncbi:hypothetical protein J3R82DRAFT_6168 [Butyriboletus roseoflavus]|nr:hypothetical protein J3R82DRAFT_6168 [Butyriboletus roseoflavus]
MSCWNEKDGEFSYLELYCLVVLFICSAIDTEWRDDLLKWWNLQLFGNEQGCRFTEKIKKEDTGMVSSSFEPIMEMSMVE